MRSLRVWNRLLVLGGVMSCVRGVLLPSPTITPAPQVAEVELRRAIAGRQGPDAVSMIEMLLTVIPISLREIAATNVPAVSSILWSEFLDNNKPDWFRNLPVDIQSYLIRQFGPSTAWLTASSSMSTRSESLNSTSSSSSSSSLSSSTGSSTPTSSSGSNGSGLTRRQKLGIGIGVGVPLGLLVVGALMFGCCFLLRRRRRRRIEGSEPPSSPGFIPRFSFQDRHHTSEYHAPLNVAHNHSTQSVMNWDDDGYSAAEWGAMPKTEPHSFGAAAPMAMHDTPMAMHDSSPIMAPAVFHTHSSNRARGTRTSYTSLRSVAEVTEPDDNITEPAFSEGKETPPPPTKSLRRLSQPLHMEVPLMLAASSVKRKPISQTSSVNSPAADAASRSLRRPTLARVHQRSSSSSGAVLSNSSSSSGLGFQTDNTTPVSDSGAATTTPNNPFVDKYEYLEDYGPEYSHNAYHDVEEGLYGGYRSLDRYPEPSQHSRKVSKTEWPLKNVISGSSTQKRTKSPLWDRVYEH